ncbi:hypothetical protein GWK26_08630 [haloarchaeon 3A1-DGR]|nr:hypothetical protein GWK26_08630 [haloarchaeon 3A1-DGR]
MTLTTDECQGRVDGFAERCGEPLDELATVGAVDDVPLCPSCAAQARARCPPRMRAGGAA